MPLTRRQFIKLLSCSAVSVIVEGGLPQPTVTDQGGEMPKERVLRVIDARRPATTYIVGGGGATQTKYADNADMVDGFDASATPTGGYLLALDGSAQFPTSVYPEAVLRDGTRALTGNWNAGTFTITADKLDAANQGLFGDTVSEHTADAGVTVDGVLLKDGLVDTVDLANFAAAQFVVMAASTYLANERVLTAGDGIDLTDAGAGGAATLAVDVTDFIDTGYGLTESGNDIRVNLAGTSGLEFATGQLQVTDAIAGNGLTIASKVLAVGAGDGIDVAADAVAVDVTDFIDTAYGLTENANDIRVNLGTGLTFSSGAIVLDWSGTPGDIQPDTSAAGGSSSYAARIDHVHGIVCAAPGADSVNVGTSAEGSATSFARSDHTHNLDESIAPTWTGQHTFQATMITRSLQPEASDSYDIGTQTLLYRKGYLSELDAVVFAHETITLLGGWLLISKGEGTVEEDVDATETQIDFGAGASLAQNDFVLFRAVGKVEYMQIGTNVSGNTWNVTRDVDGSGANTWPQGAPYVNLGYNGTGRIELNAYDTPRIQLLTQGTAYNQQTEVVRVGDLNGNWGYSSAVYGAAIGEYASGKTNVVVDPTNGVRLRVYNATRFQVKNDGSLWAGDTETTERMEWDATNGFQILNASNQAVVKFPTSGNAEIIGTLLITGVLATGVSPNPRVQINSSYLAGYSDATTKEFYLDCTTGEAYAGGGVVKLDAAGIAVEVSTSFQDVRSYQFKNSGGTVVGTVDSYQDAGNVHYVRVHAPSIAGESAFVLMKADAPSGETADTVLQSVYDATTTVNFWVRASGTETFGRLMNAHLEVAKGLYIGAIDVEPPDDTIIADRGIYLGRNADPGAGNVAYTGGLKSYKGTTEYDAYPLHALDVPILANDFQGTGYSTVSTSTKIDNETDWGSVIPASAKALLLQIVCTESSVGDYWFAVGPSATHYYAMACRPTSGNDYSAEKVGPVPCTDGDIWYRCSASGSGTLDVTIRCWGYYL